MDIMNKTYELIDALEKSDLFRDLDSCKNKIMGNIELRNLIDVGNKTSDDYVLLDIKKKLCNYDEYVEYTRIYNEIMYIVMDINNKYKSLFKERKCYR